MPINYIKCDRDGPPPHFGNCVRLIEGSPQWAGVLRWNEHSLLPDMKKPAPWSHGKVAPWDDHAYAETLLWVHEQGLPANKTTVGEAVDHVAQRNPYHPVREYLDGLTWDGEPQMEWLLAALCIAPSRYTLDVVTSFMVSAVNRAYEPGCQADYMPILWGPEGIYKTSAVEKLAGKEFYVNGLGSKIDKDTAAHVRMGWVIEDSEFIAGRRSSAEEFKAFVSRKVDVYRKPYAKLYINAPRQSVLIGTCTISTFLHDPVGNRRLWPLHCDPSPGSTIDLLAVEMLRDDVWAEAVALYRSGRKGYLTNPEAIDGALEAQEASYEPDILESLVDSYIRWGEDDQEQLRSPIFIKDMVEELLRYHPNVEALKRKDVTRQISIRLQKAGYKRDSRLRVNGRRQSARYEVTT